MYERWVPGMSGGLYCHQLAPKQRLPPPHPPPAGNPRNPAMSPSTTQSHPSNSHTEFMVENKGMGRDAKNENKQCTPQKKPKGWNGASAELCCCSLPLSYRLLFIVNSIKFHLTASESWLTYFIMLLVDTYHV